MRRTTLQDIANHLGLSKSAVSLGLRNAPKIPIQTRKRIRAAAKELGYAPNSILSELASTRWQSDPVASGTVIAYINCIRPGQPYWFGMIANLQKRAAELGYKVEPFLRAGFSSSAKLQRVLRNRGITDVIIGPIFEEDFAIELDWEKFISIQILPGFFPLRLHSVIRDRFSSVVLAWQKAVSYGYRRIGIILLDHPFPLMDDVMRLSAVYACQRQLFPDLPVVPPFHHPYDDILAEPFIAWFKKHQPDVIIGFTGAHYEVFQSKFGRDHPYAALHTDIESSISGIPDPEEVFAVEAINLLHYCRRSYQWGIPAQRIDHVVEPIWFEGTTLPNKNAALA
jgi:LacI family transcriptional regulator